ncbi:MAG: flagellar motor switch protein FliN [Acidobacteriaceae bacterium]
MEQFVKIYSDAIASVLSQSSGAEWKVERQESAGPAADIHLRIVCGGGFTGEFSVEFDSETGRSLAEALLGPGESALAEQQEALLELFRQICGVAATDLRPRFSEVSFALSLVPQASHRENRITVGLRKGDWTGSVVMVFSEEIVAALSGRAVETDWPAPERAQSGRNLDLLLDVQLGIRLRFGSRRMRLREILELQPGSVVELDRQVQDPVDLLVDTKLIGRGEVVVIDNHYGLRVGEVVTPRQRIESLEQEAR